MLRKKALILSLILFVAQPTSLYASAELTFNRAIDYLVHHNPEFMASKQRIEASEWLRRRAVGLHLPTLSARMGVARQGSNAPESSEATSYSAGLDLRQSLFAGLSHQASVTSADAELELARVQHERLLTRLERDLRVALANLNFITRAIPLFEEIAERREENLRLVELRFEGGAENQGSVLLSRANHRESLLETFRIRQEQKSFQQNLKRLLGVEEELNYQSTEAPPQVVLPEELNLNQLADGHIDIIQEEHRIDRARAGLTQSRSAFYPTIDLQAGLSRNDQVFFPERESWSVGLNLSIPLFNGGRDFAQAQASLREIQQSLEGRRSGQYEVEDELVSNYNNLLVLRERVEVERTFLEASRIRAEISRERYNSGLLSFEDWLNIENDYASRIRSTLNSERDYAVAQARWLFALGINSDDFKSGLSL